MPGVHRNGDPRVCGALTIVTGQNSVYANGRLIAVNGDQNSHGGGNLISGSNNVFSPKVNGSFSVPGILSSSPLLLIYF